jgi:hypothetical protein
MARTRSAGVLRQCEDILPVILLVAAFMNEVITGRQLVSVAEER